MHLLNFAHPLTEEQKQKIEALLGQPLQSVRYIPVQIDTQGDFVAQIQELIQTIDLSPQEWQNLPILINPPSLNFATAVLLAELHGRMGYFPPIVRLRPVSGSIPPRFEVAEIINLQELREKARRQRI